MAGDGILALDDGQTPSRLSQCVNNSSVTPGQSRLNIAQMPVLNSARNLIISIGLSILQQSRFQRILFAIITTTTTTTSALVIMSLSAYLLVFRKSADVRAHFAVFFVYPDSVNATPETGTDCRGLLLHVVGMKKHGYETFVGHGYSTEGTKTLRKAVFLGSVPAEMVPFKTDVSTSTIGRVFLDTPVPEQSFYITAPVDDVSFSIFVLALFISSMVLASIVPFDDFWRELLLTSLISTGKAGALPGIRHAIPGTPRCEEHPARRLPGEGTSRAGCPRLCDRHRRALEPAPLRVPKGPARSKSRRSKRRRFWPKETGRR